MKIRREKQDFDTEHLILTGVIVSDKVCEAVCPLLDADLLESPWARRIARWVTDYYKNYQNAPQKTIRDIFYREAERLPEEESEMIAKYLEYINDRFLKKPHINEPYVIDTARTHLETRRLRRLAESITLSLDRGKTVDARRAVAEFEHPGNRRYSQAYSWINPLEDIDAITEAMTSTDEVLVTFPGALGQMLNRYFVRDGFVGYMGPEKRGKSWFLQEAAWRAAMRMNNVAYFQVGDMSRNQSLRRIQIRASRRPDRPRYCGTYNQPVLDCWHNQRGTCDLSCRACQCVESLITEGPDGQSRIPFDEAPPDYVPCTACRKRKNGKFLGTYWFRRVNIEEPLELEDALIRSARWSKMLKGRKIMMGVFPNNSISVNGIRTQLDLLEMRDGFVPDVIVIDYADILAPTNAKDSTRDQQNATWMSLRGLSLERHCLVVTATQTDSASYEARRITMKNFSEDKRKLGHVTAMLSLNQLPEEKSDSIMRIGTVLAREEEFFITDEVTVLMDLRTGRPITSSFFNFMSE